MNEGFRKLCYSSIGTIDIVTSGCDDRSKQKVKFKLPAKLLGNDGV